MVTSMWLLTMLCMATYYFRSSSRNYTTPSRPYSTRYAKQGSVLLGATAKVNTEQMKQLSSSKVQG